jgi:predicted acylesterase/phospholipase RssA
MYEGANAVRNPHEAILPGGPPTTSGRAPTRALVLSGGGARGAYEAGVIKGLFGQGEEFEIICGTSIGALNGSFVAQDKLAELDSTWRGIAARNVIQLVPAAAQLKIIATDLPPIIARGFLQILLHVSKIWSEIHKLGSLTNLLTLLGGIDPTPIASILNEHLEFDALRRQLIVSATNLSLGTSDAFYWFPDADTVAKFQAANASTYALTPNNVRDAVRASAAIPGAFAPVTVAAGSQACQYVDGGVANNTPIGQAMDAGADDVLIIFMDPDDNTAKPQPIQNLAQIGFDCFGVMQQKILSSDLKTAQRVNQSVRAGDAGLGSGGPRREVRLRAVRPQQPLPLSVLQFDRQDLVDQAYEQGLEDSRTIVDISG